MSKLLNLIKTFGKEKINTLTKYPSILTLHRIGERGKLTDALTTDITHENMSATEKIDGTNVRIITLGDEFLIGSREFILHYSGDTFYDMAQGIVDNLKIAKLEIPKTDKLTVFYGELFGGKLSSNSRQYGTEKVDFRLFDIVEFNDLSILGKDVREISVWRERETEDGMVYGQPFLTKEQLKSYPHSFKVVPEVEFELQDYNHQTVLDTLNKALPETKVALTESATKKPEGLILRNSNRTKIVKIRFEDYTRTLKK